MFIHVNNIKTAKRSLLEVSSVASIMTVESYYLNYESFVNKPAKNELFEPEEDHYLLYKINIKDE